MLVRLQLLSWLKDLSLRNRGQHLQNFVDSYFKLSNPQAFVPESPKTVTLSKFPIEENSPFTHVPDETFKVIFPICVFPLNAVRE